ncbi:MULTISPECIES: hypothetical protein [Alicyclobacillus]|uniref:Uncharacterized protein n=1 Tax=Alicyclobacillus acidoterrestris (strain ATCC 49025 / DSM 3922 / CIP 106132 / NCIMB 13137 / GD3B) TaxID=1356854 RepID=T0C5T3_ALIAG|nr:MULTISPECIES: hypothetical protein [Alicyclobacillus]EPZ47900.1 hypothetical protein N007_04895 [Alicyclobacillus acidoterrestris ATCC 49025]UNO51034.1 hypothetical protein K1I37_20880 [Alicyclobacillus acidoterrestris]GEO27762.1 hypothetical protein AAC03nite_35470 [Alicyclobacillus acidoterrestris]
MEKLQVVKEWSKRQAKRVKEKSTKMSFRGSLEEITGRGWIFVVVVVGIVMFIGPQVFHLVRDNMSSSVNTVSSNFNISDYTD